MNVIFSEKLMKLFHDSLLTTNIIKRFLFSTIKSNINYIDIENANTISFITEDRLRKLYKNYIRDNKFISFESFLSENDFWSKYRSTMKIGRFVKKIINDNEVQWQYVIDCLSYNEKPNDLEIFVNYFAAVAKKVLDKNLYNKIKIVSGEEIRKWYYEDNYSAKIGSIGNSCMRYGECQSYFDIYVENNDVCNLIIFQEQDKISMRALLWKLENKFYMDRIYSQSESDAIILMNYAEEQGWDYYDKSNFKQLKLKLNNCDYDEYPYMDTFKYLDLTNNLLYVNLPENFEYDITLYEMDSQEGRYNVISRE